MKRKQIESVELKKGDGSIIRLKQRNSPTGLSKFWYILYYVAGRQIRENTHTEQWQQAYDLLLRRRHESAKGQQPVSEITRIRYEDLRDALLEDYRLRHVGSPLSRHGGDKAFHGLKYVDKFFKNFTASQITPDAIRRYIAWRREEGHADPTIRRNLVHLRAAFHLAVKEGKLLSMPYFPMPRDSEPAGQYVDPVMFADLLPRLPSSLRSFFTFLYYTACRIGAVKQITWEMVNREATEIRLPGAIIKSRSPLLIVLAGRGLQPVSDTLKNKPRFIGGRVFDITNYRASWTKLCKQKRITVRIHDLRCSAAVNLTDAGVPQDTVMKIGGWKTTSMFSRYNVMNTERLKKAMIQGGDYVASQIQMVNNA